MSRSATSPTARLLRSSRLFSLPPPLPRPGHDLTTAAGAVRNSDTATLPYPTIQAIVTPQSSLSRGDWGLKRPLPLRSTTNTSTPALRITVLDTIEHITDYQSAGDHTRTLHKWQKLNMPMSVHGARKQVSRGGSAKSVFETDIDNTDRVESSNPRAPTAERWKYDGPWLGGMTEGEFQEYVQKGISHRKTEFTAYVKQHIREKILSDRRREYRTEGRDWNDEVDGVVELSDLDFADHLKVLRGDTKLNSELSRLIRNFFDLPAMPAQDSKTSGEFSALQTQIESLIGNTDTGPPMTHPSAGLSYLRTASYLRNHPVLGPQKKQTPIQSRVLQTRNSALGNNRQAKLGVAGVVAEDQAQAGGFRDDAAVTTLDPELEGGNKLWVHPWRAAINAGGRIKLEVERAGKEAVAVHSGDLSTIPTPMVFSTPPRGGQRVNEPLPGAEPPYARYGYGLSHTPLGQRPAPQYRAQALDSTAADEITRLMEEGIRRRRERDDTDS